MLRSCLAIVIAWPVVSVCAGNAPAHPPANTDRCATILLRPVPCGLLVGCAPRGTLVVTVERPVGKTLLFRWHPGRARWTEKRSLQGEAQLVVSTHGDIILARDRHTTLCRVRPNGLALWSASVKPGKLGQVFWDGASQLVGGEAWLPANGPVGETAFRTFVIDLKSGQLRWGPMGRYGVPVGRDRIWYFRYQQHARPHTLVYEWTPSTGKTRLLRSYAAFIGLPTVSSAMPHTVVAQEFSANEGEEARRLVAISRKDGSLRVLCPGRGPVACGTAPYVGYVQEGHPERLAVYCLRCARTFFLAGSAKLIAFGTYKWCLGEPQLVWQAPAGATAGDRPLATAALVFVNLASHTCNAAGHSSGEL